MDNRSTTTKLPAAPPYAVDLANRMAEGFQAVNSQLDTLSQRVSSLEGRAEHLEQRTDTHSDRVQSSADDNLQQDAAIAALSTRVEQLKTKADAQLVILERLDKIAENPFVRRIAWALGLALLAYLAKQGVVAP